MNFYDDVIVKNKLKNINVYENMKIISIYPKYFDDHFDEWWDPDKFNWKSYSHYLSIYFSRHFNKWWDPEKFDWNETYKWDSGLIYLIKYCSEYFNIWWNPDKIDLREEFYHLAEYCPNYFDIWWDSSKIDLNKHIETLARDFSDKFHTWWNPEKFDWRKNSFYLANYCSKYFDIWWNPEKYDWKSSSSLVLYCKEHFNKWWNVDKFDWHYNHWHLLSNCLEYFDKWWIPEKFNSLDTETKKRMFIHLMKNKIDRFPIYWEFFKKECFVGEAKTLRKIGKYAKSHFDVWWPDVEKVLNGKNVKFIFDLIINYSDKFCKWWPKVSNLLIKNIKNADTIEDVFELLPKYCMKNKSEWSNTYIKMFI